MRILLERERVSVFKMGEGKRWCERFWGFRSSSTLQGGEKNKMQCLGGFTVLSPVATPIALRLREGI